MYLILSILIFLASILLIIVVLIQKSKGGGLASSASNYNQIMGVRKTTDFVEKLTWGLAVFICVLSIGTSLVMSHAQKSSANSASKQLTTEKAEKNPNNFNTVPQPAASQPAQDKAASK